MEKLTIEEKKQLKNQFTNEPYFGLVGIKLLEIEKGYCRTSFSFRKELTNANKVVHGGALVSLADSCAAYAAMSLTGIGRAYTVQLTSNFFSPIIDKDKEIIAEARIISATKSIIVVGVELKNRSDKPKMQYQGTFLKIK